MITLPQSCYIVFFRLCDMDKMPADRLAGTVEAFDRILCELPAETLTFSSPYGGGVLSSTVAEALFAAQRVMTSLGAGVAVGLACGMIREVRDVTGRNYVGHALNRAARLAHIPQLQGRAAVSREFVEDAQKAEEALRMNFFGPQKNKTVKRTKLIYHIIQDPSFIYQVNLIPAVTLESIRVEPMHVLLFDLVRYSELSEQEEERTVERLAKEVIRAHEYLGRGPISKDSEISYAPAGDGGAVIFKNPQAKAAWLVARELQTCAKASGLEMRLGLDSGQMALRGHGCPLGPAIVDADRVSQCAEPGQICLTRRFLEHVPEEDRELIKNASSIKIVNNEVAEKGTQTGECFPVRETSRSYVDKEGFKPSAQQLVPAIDMRSPAAGSSNVRDKAHTSAVAIYRQCLRENYGKGHYPVIGEIVQKRCYWELQLRHVSRKSLLSAEQLLDKNLPVLPETGLILIEADPGSGKTVLLDHLAWRAGLIHERTPVFLRLHRVVTGQDFSNEVVSLNQIIPHEIEHLMANNAFTEEVFNRIISDKGIVLLDGWDEVPSTERQTLGREIVALARSTRVVVTTRRHQDIAPLRIDSSTPHFEICELSPKTIEAALKDELSCIRDDEQRYHNLQQLLTHWKSGAITIQHLARNPQMLRLLIDFYGAEGSTNKLLSEIELIRKAVAFTRKGRESSAFPSSELEPGGSVVKALGAWCWKTISDPSLSHGHREITCQAIAPFWKGQQFSEHSIQGWFDHLAVNSIWFHRIGEEVAFGEEPTPVFQLLHPIFMTYLAAISLVARALGQTFQNETGKEESSLIIDELCAFALCSEKGGVDPATAGQVFRFFAALMPPPRTVRVEDVLCQLLQQNDAGACRMAFHLVAGESQAHTLSKTILGTSSSSRRGTAERIASQIRSKPRRDRVSMVRSWYEEACSFRQGRDEDRAIELVRVLKGLLLTPSGRGSLNQSITAPMNHWAERDSEIIVRSYAIAIQLERRMFPDLNQAPDEFHQLLDGRLNLLRPGPASGACPQSGYWVDVLPGRYFVGDSLLAQEGRAFPRSPFDIVAQSSSEAAGNVAIKIGKYPVTVREFREFDPEHRMGLPYDEPARPKVYLTWFDALLYARWRARVADCPGIDLVAEREWEAAVSSQRTDTEVIRYPWRGEPGQETSPSKWRAQVHRVLASLDPNVLKILGSDDPWEYGPWLLPINDAGQEVCFDLGNDLRQNALGIWDANGVAQWTFEAATNDLDTSSGLKSYHDRSRYVRGAGWGPGRDELYRCAYRRAFTPDFSSFLTGCRLVWRSQQSPIDPVAEKV